MKVLMALEVVGVIVEISIQGMMKVLMAIPGMMKVCMALQVQNNFGCKVGECKEKAMGPPPYPGPRSN